MAAFESPNDIREKAEPIVIEEAIFDTDLGAWEMHWSNGDVTHSASMYDVFKSRTEWAEAVGLEGAAVRTASVRNSNEDEDDPVNHPSHYTNGSIECIDAMEAAFGKKELATYCKIAAFKYIWRCELKDGVVQDLKKARWYIDKTIQLLE